ncbi:MAG: tRNA1(Val) (adenine(37)-N6)-methyltransferase [Alphaproteobacteria bacterium]
MTASGEEASEDLLLGGRVRLRQPRSGYRTAIDPVLLAAAVEAKHGALVLDAGLGAGAVSLCLLARRPDLRVIGIESDPDSCALARSNAAANGVADRLEVRCGALESLAKAMAAAGERVDAVVTNPPYLTAAQADASPEAGRQRANVESVSLAGWIAACARPLRAKGMIVLVHRADRLDDAILALRWAGCAEIAILPLWPRSGEDARRVLVRARKGIAGTARLLPGLVLHQVDGRFTPAAEAILRDGAALVWKGSTLPPDSSS